MREYFNDSTPELLEKVKGYCDNDLNATVDYLDQMILALKGEPGEYGCDMLQLLYEGNPYLAIYKGMRDEMMQKVGIILIDVLRGYNMISGCQELASPSDTSSSGPDSVVSKYGDDYIAILDRILEFD